jgi:nucleotide-binding universal stress UspA family protein
MTSKLKLLIAYDGSEWADAALEDLRNAGLPKTADVVVMSMADVFLPPPISEEERFPTHVPVAVRRALERSERKLVEAKSMAKRASDQLYNSFPQWNVTAEALADSPAWSLIRKIDQWRPDLVVVGAQGHSVFGGRLILGSVSQRVLYEARCSVRIARRHRRQTDSPLRLIIGVDNSADSNAAVEAVFNREWPRGTAVRLLVVVDTVMAITPDPSQPSVVKWIEVADVENWNEVRQIFQPSLDRLRSAGLDAAMIVRRGSPADEIVAEAVLWNANCVFVGAKGTRGIDRLLLGSVSSAVSARAHCSVEVVRPGSMASAGFGK